MRCLCTPADSPNLVQFGLFAYPASARQRAGLLDLLGDRLQELRQTGQHDLHAHTQQQER